MYMNIVIVTDSFKGSLTSFEAGCAVRDGFLEAMPEADITVLPVADGGEGTVEALTSGGRGKLIKCTVTSPIGERIVAQYGILNSGTCVIEIASAAGLTLVPNDLRNPMLASTRGVGELILDALDHRCRNFIIGIGGSATNDGGMGMLSALGYRFTDIRGEDITEGCAMMSSIAKISSENADKRLSECRFRVACDVTNVLLGANGCSAVFAPQKGARDDDIKFMDSALAVYAQRTCEYISPDANADFPGTGAAGGLGYALKYYLGATLERGCPLIMEETGAEEYIAKSQLVVTGEGRLDSQSFMGKLPMCIASLGKRYNVPVIALGGGVDVAESSLRDSGITACFPIVHAPCSLETAMQPEIAKKNLRRTAEQIARVMRISE